MSEDWLSLVQDCLPWVREWGPLAVSTLCLLLLYAALHQFSRLKDLSTQLKERSTRLEATLHRDITLLLLEPLPERCEMLKRGLTAVGMGLRHPPHGPKAQAIEAEHEAFLATRRDLQEQVRAASQGLDQMRGPELSDCCLTLASLRQRTDQLIAAIQKREDLRDNELQDLRNRATR